MLMVYVYSCGLGTFKLNCIYMGRADIAVTALEFSLFYMMLGLRKRERERINEITFLVTLSVMY